MRAILKIFGLAGLAGLTLLLQAAPAAKEAPSTPVASNGILGQAVAMPEEILSEGDSSSIDLVSGVVTLEGHAKVWDKDKKMVLSADRIVMTSDADQRLVKVETFGHVVFVGKTLIAGKETEFRISGGYGVYQVVEQLLTLTEKPRVEWGRNVVEKMEKVVYSKKTGKIDTAGGKTAADIFPADIPKSTDGEQPAATPAAAPKQ
jgi:lipopolysaccharide export system protein LptA